MLRTLLHLVFFPLALNAVATAGGPIDVGCRKQLSFDERFIE